MVKDSGADNLIEARLQFVRPLDGKLVDLKISQVVFSFELFGTAHARFAEVDTYDSRCRPADRVLCRLRGPAAGDQNGMAFVERPRRPKQVEFRTALLWVSPGPI